MMTSRLLIFATLSLSFVAKAAFAHNVTAGDAGYVQEIWGVNIIPFMYLGAKHMVTGYDHLLFLLGVVFFLYRAQQVALYVSLFALGHSTTMLLGVFFEWGINAYIVDAIIGLSVVYKVLDNLGAYQRWFNFQPNNKMATLVFGLFHGTGLASKLLDYDMSTDGLLENLLAFNVGVELGQLTALWVILIVMGVWRRRRSFLAEAYSFNVVMMSGGFLLTGFHLSGYLLTS